jgi:anaphase-promoting complex subunit 3
MLIRQERFDVSEYHFRRAIKINPRSSVLRCYLGMVLHAQGTSNEQKSVEALHVLTEACGKDPMNPQLRFQLATVLLATGKVEEAWREFYVVGEMAQKESLVYALLAQVCQTLGRHHEAHWHYLRAIDIDPHRSSSLKNVLRGLQDLSHN